MRITCEEGLTTTVNILMALLDKNPTLGDGDGKRNIIVTTLFLASQDGFNSWVDPLLQYSIETIGTPIKGTGLLYLSETAHDYDYSNIVSYLHHYQGEDLLTSPSSQGQRICKKWLGYASF